MGSFAQVLAVLQRFIPTARRHWTSLDALQMDRCPPGPLAPGSENRTERSVSRLRWAATGLRTLELHLLVSPSTYPPLS